MKSLCLLALLVSFAAFAAEVDPSEERALESGSWKLPSVLPVARLEKLLNRMVAQVHGKGFRYLGVFEDFDHGHVVYEEKKLPDGSHRLIPRAILYHTQEQAHSAHWHSADTHVDKKFDYLNTQARNWMQWLTDDEKTDGQTVENALPYLDWNTKQGKAYSFSYVPLEGVHFTIGARSLAAEKMGFAVYSESQFEFHTANCEPTKDFAARGPIRVVLPDADHTSVCLELTTHVPMFRTADWQ